MKRFFPSPSLSPQSEKKQRKEIIRQFNEEINQALMQHIQDNFTEVSNELKQLDFTDDQIKEFFINYIRKVQAKAAEELQNQVREAALARSKNPMPPPAPPPNR